MHTNQAQNLYATPPEFEQHTPLVRSIARTLRRELHLHEDIVEFDDLVHFGYVGLLEALRRFDPSRGSEFRAFAYKHIQGAMLDGLRKMTRLPRRAYEMLRVLRLHEELEELEQIPSDPLAAVLQHGRMLARTGFLILQTPYPTPPEPAEAPSPEDLTASKLAALRARALLDSLPDPDGEVARRYCLHGETLEDIGRDLGLSRSWTCRILERATQSVARSFGEERRARSYPRLRRV